VPVAEKEDSEKYVVILMIQKRILRAFYWEVLKQIVQIYHYIKNVHP